MVEVRPTRNQLVLLSKLQLHLICAFALEQLKGRLTALQPPAGPQSSIQDLAPHKV